MVNESPGNRALLLRENRSRKRQSERRGVVVWAMPAPDRSDGASGVYSSGAHEGPLRCRAASLLERNCVGWVERKAKPIIHPAGASSEAMGFARAQPILRAAVRSCGLRSALAFRGLEHGQGAPLIARLAVFPRLDGCQGSSTAEGGDAASRRRP